MKNFLSAEQISKLNKWDATKPNGAYVTIYRDEVKPSVWQHICEVVECNSDAESVQLLFFAYNYNQ